MTTFLALQSTYTGLELGLYRELTCLGSAYIDKMRASKECIIALERLLQECSLAMKDLSFIAVNQGPGPFTTLRVAIATVNGLAFARTISLVGINGIEALIWQYRTAPFKNKVVILNAFGSDLYYGISSDHGSVTTGCGSIDRVILEVTQKITDGSILFLGNGVEIAFAQIRQALGDRAHILDNNPAMPALESIADLGLQEWKNQQAISYQLQPLYFKEAFYKL